jgi:hypothetical protein
MGYMNMIGGLLEQYAGGQSPERQQAFDHYDQIHQSVPSGLLGSVIGPALSSLGGSEVQQRVCNSAGQMSPEQRGGLMQSLLGGLTSSGENPMSLLQGLGMRQSLADNPNDASPEEVAQLAAHAHETNPGVFGEAMSFYSEHPALVKALGSVAIGAIAKELFQRQ